MTMMASLNSRSRIWIKQPLAIYTANQLDASNGLVIENNKIIEVLAKD